MRVFAVFDLDGLPAAFYPNDIHPDPVSGAVEISDEDWAAFVAEPGAWRWRDGARVAAPAPLVPAPVVPSSATKLGLKRALAEAGRWPAVKAAIAADPDVQEDWDLATLIRRDDPVTQAIVAGLGYGMGEVDALLVRAAALTA